jgi:hypothetical protein
MSSLEIEGAAEGQSEHPDRGGAVAGGAGSAPGAAEESAFDSHGSYDGLLRLVGQSGGQLEIVLSTTEVGTEKRQRFPYRGYALSWAKRMQGAVDGLEVDLTTTDVGTRKTLSFPYSGYGYGWARRMQGRIGGQDVSLEVVEVGKERTFGFPWRGHGYAWAQEFRGECGGQLQAHLSTTEVGRARERGFPYFGYGYAWAKKAVLTLRLMRLP